MICLWVECDHKIKEINRKRTFRKLPTQTAIVVDCCLKVVPEFIVGVGAFMAEPYSDNVVNVPIEECEAKNEGRACFKFMDAKIKTGVVGSWRCSHCCAGFLYPARVIEAKNIILHDNFEGSQDGIWVGDAFAMG